MHRHLILTLLLLAIGVCSKAQSYTISGKVMDTLSDAPLSKASITLIHAKDSVLESFTRTRADGSFSLQVKTKDKYIVMATFPGLVDYVDEISISDEKPVNLGVLAMTSRTHLLQEVVIKQQYAAIKVKGDTLEYVADSFKVRDGATVEALLKKLPGIQVDKNGQIVAQGEKVQKVLVDGEEFFTDDPAVVTKGLQAKVVDKVQVFDKKSDQAEFTGIDDGEKTKTINLQLKDDKKKGYFGKIVAGGGAGDDQTYFENQAMVNSFKGKRQLSAFGIMSNTGKIGLGWQDRDKYSSSGSSAVMTDDGDMYTTYGSDDWDNNFDSWNGNYNGQGLPKAWTGGLHYADKFKGEQHHLSANYRYAKQNVETSGNTLTEYNLPGNNKYFTKENRELFTSGQRHRGDGLYEWKIDSLSTLKVTANANFINTKSTSIYKGATLDTSGNATNTSDRSITNDGTSKAVNATVDWRKKFKKKGRTVSLNVTEKYKESDGDGFLKSSNKFYDGSVNNIDQHKENESSSFSLSSRIAYTEPLSKVMFLELNYSLKVDNNEAQRNTFTKRNPVSDTYDSLDAKYSSHFAYNILTNAGGTNLRFVFKKINFSFGGSVSNASFNQQDRFKDTSNKYSFTNFFPSAAFTYKLSKQSKFSINYNGSTRQPTLQQIQPLNDNNDPLNVAIGNPNITQEFTHSFYAQFNDYKMLTGRWIWMNGNFTIVDNAISRTENTDALGRRTYQYVNVDGNYNAWAWVGCGSKIKKLSLDVGGHISTNIRHINNYVNGVRNQSNNNSYTAGLEFRYNSKNEKLSLNFEPEMSYNDNTATISTLTTSYWTNENKFEASYEFSKKFEIGTDANWFIRQRTAVFDRNNNVFQWNAYVSRKFLKNNQLELRASVFDILNQNIGFNRFAQNNYVTEDKYNTIRRYGLLSLTWNFTKSPLTAPAAADILNAK